MGLAVASLGLIGLGSFTISLVAIPKQHIIFMDSAGTCCCLILAVAAAFTKVRMLAPIGLASSNKDPEDDQNRRIADNVGDNVGDVAGMGSDIFESYVGSMIATIAIASTLAAASISALAPNMSEGDGRATLMFLPLALASTGLICSILGIIAVRAMSTFEPAKALRFGMIGTTILFMAAAYVLVNLVGLTTSIWYAVLFGAAGGICIGLITEYYTASTPVVNIAESGKTGPATVMITGLSVGMQSVVGPLVICAIIWFPLKWLGCTELVLPQSDC